MKVFLVVGCHRSATSLIAKGLHDCGVHMGDKLLGGGKSNPEGHYEHQDAIHMHDRLLKGAGGSWRKPPPRKRIREVGLPSIKDYVQQRVEQGHEMWGLKDPRLCLFWQLYEEALEGFDYHLISVWRKPDEIAKSLHRRSKKISYEEGLRIAHEYQRRMP